MKSRCVRPCPKRRTKIKYPPVSHTPRVSRSSRFMQASRIIDEDHLTAASGRALKIVVEHILRDLLSERGSIVTRSPEVDTGENAGVLHFLQRVCEASERARYAQ